MKKIIYLFVAILVLLFAVVVPVYAHGGGYVRGGIWIGGPVWPWWGPPYYPYYPYYYSEPPVVIQQAPVYEQQAPVEEQQSYWYFCPDAKAYYPYVKQCPGGWMKVIPNQSPPKGKE